MYTGSVTFDEENDARPVYIGAAVVTFLLFLDHLFFHLHTRTIFICALLVAGVTAILALQCLMGCIWHPIPLEYRQDGGATSLHLSGSLAQPSTAEAAPQMFGSLEDQTMPDNGDPVDSSQTEVRDNIEWRKLILVTLCVAGNVLLLVIWAH